MVLPRAQLDVTILLPLGSEAGTYEVRLRDRTLSIRVGATGEADVSDSVTMLRVPLNTVELLAGAYQLDVRRAGEEWRTASAQVK